MFRLQPRQQYPTLPLCLYMCNTKTFICVWHLCKEMAFVCIACFVDGNDGTMLCCRAGYDDVGEILAELCICTFPVDMYTTCYKVTCPLTVSTKRKSC